MRNYRFSLDIFPFLKKDKSILHLAFTPTIAAHIQHRLGSGDSGDLAAWQLGWLQVLAAARDIVVASIQVVHLHYLSFTLYSYYIPLFIHLFVQVVHHFHSLSFTLYSFSLFHPSHIYHFGQTKASLPGENDPDLETSQATSAIRLFLYKVLWV